MLKLSVMRKLSFIVLLIVGLVLPFSSSVAQAQAANPSDDEVNRVASQLFCPICENMPLDVCPIEACQQWRELIREQLAEGWTEGEIKAYFVNQYGDRVLGEPPRSGLNWILYAAPPIVILFGVVLFLSKVKRSTQKAPPREVDQADPYLAQVERDLGKLD